MLLSFQFLIRRTEFLIYPFTWAVVLLLLALLTFNRNRRRRLLSWSLVLLLVFSNSFIVDEVARWWEADVTPIAEIDPQISTAILLGGGVYHDKETGQVKYGYNADRYLSVLRPYRAGKIKKILVSGGAANYLEPWAKEADIIKRLFVLCGIPSEDVLVEDRSMNTYENAKYCKSILEATGEKKFLLITSSAHVRRAMACFRKQGIDVQPYSVMKSVGKRRWEIDYLLVPRISNIGKWNGLIHEWIGYLSYKVRGYC